MNNKLRFFKILGVILFLFGSGCAFAVPEGNDQDYITESQSLDNASTVSTTDQLEPFNRGMFGFNRFMDTILFRPIAKVYDFVLPNFVQKGVNNFFSNIGEIPRVANDVLQGNGTKAISDTFRFAINSTVGVGGVFDVASKAHLPKTHTDFGITLAKWGVKHSPYIVLPFLGPLTMVDTIALWPEYEYLSIWPHIDPKRVRYELLGLDYIRIRDGMLPSDKLIDQAFDPYSLVKNAYLQHRNYLLEQSRAPYKRAETAD